MQKGMQKGNKISARLARRRAEAREMGKRVCEAPRTNGEPCLSLIWRWSRWCAHHRPKWVRPTQLAAALGVALLTYASDMGQLWTLWKDLSGGEYYGKLTPPGPGSISRFSIGNAVFPLADPAGVVLRDGHRTLLKIEERNGDLLVTAEFVGRGGEVLAYLERNEWKVNPDEAFERNYTSRLLEVRDRRRDVVLQVIHLGDTVNVEGVMTCSSGRQIILAQSFGDRHDRSPMGPSPNVGVITLAPPGMEPPHRPEPVCRYPAEHHLGECPGVGAIEEEFRAYKLAKYDWTLNDLCEIGNPLRGFNLYFNQGKPRFRPAPNTAREQDS